MKHLGERIKRKRESLHMQLNELAKKVGVSSSALSQIENSKAFPSIVTLKSIADNLHTTIGEIIGEHEAMSKNPLVRFNDKSFIEKNEFGVSTYLLSNHDPNKQMDTILIKFSIGGNSKNILKAHHGQSFFFVLEGELEFELDGKNYNVKRNDSFYFNASRKHIARNISTNETTIILISTPPEQ